MIYLDNGATSFHKPESVYRAVFSAMRTCANPGRGGYREAITAGQTVYQCREAAGEMFGCNPEQVVLLMKHHLFFILSAVHPIPAPIHTISTSLA